MAVVFDVLFRLLRHIYGAEHVTYVRNITDVDDKINARAAQSGVGIRELTERTARQYQDDVAAMGCLTPTAEPRATEYIRRADNKLDMVRLIEQLVAARPRLCGRRARAVRCGLDARLRPALQPLAGGDGGGRAGGGGALQEGAHGLRAVEALQARRAGVALAGGHQDAGPAGLAHRVLGHGGGAAGRDVRHPRRRHRPGLPAPRERDRPEPLRPRHAADGALLAAQRLPHGARGREDVEVARQLHHHPRPAAGVARRGAAAWPSSPPSTASRCPGPTRR